MTSTMLQVGHSFLDRRDNCYVSDKQLLLLHRNLGPLDSVMKCVQMNWMAILVNTGTTLNDDQVVKN